jgi:hypothetical protein
MQHYGMVTFTVQHNGTVTPREVSPAAKKPKRFLLSPQREVMTKRFETEEVSIERSQCEKRILPREREHCLNPMWLTGYPIQR